MPRFIWLLVGLLTLILLLPPHLTALDRAPWSPAKRYFGTDAFVPDWRRAEAIDDQASRRFVAQYWNRPFTTPKHGRFPALKRDYDKGGSALPRALTAAEKRAGVVVWIQPYIEPLPFNATPTPTQRAVQAVSRFAALGESEPIGIGVRTLERSKTIALEVSDLQYNTHTISREHITTRLSLGYKARYSRRAPDQIYRQMVLLKPPDGRWRFPQRYAHVYMVDIHVPVNAQPGFYQGTIRVKADGKRVKTIGVTLDVVPFRLKTNHFHAGGFGCTYNTWAGGFSTYYEGMIELDSRYGYNLCGGFFNKGNDIPFTTTAEGELVVHEGHPKFAIFNRTMQLMARYGMGRVAFWNWGAPGSLRQFDAVLKAAGFPSIRTEAGKRGFAEICHAIKQGEKKHGWPELVINPFDEALKDQDATREVNQAASYVHERSPETRLYMTEWRKTYTRLYQSSGDTLAGKTRPRGKELAALRRSGEPPQFNYHVIGANKLDLSARQLMSRFGGEYWHYFTLTRLNPRARMVYGFQAWIVQAEAALVWANWKGDLMGNGWTMHYAMPDDPETRGSEGLYLPSARAIAMREGIDDRKYIETLRYYATIKHSQVDLDYLDRLSMRSRQLLSDLEAMGGVENIETTVTDTSAMQMMRIELKDRILALIRK